MNKIRKEMAITVRNLKKAYKKKSVLKGIDFDVESGSIFALLGSNGAGKTTTVKILSTLLKPDEGDVHIHGYALAHGVKDIQKCISLTGQYATVDEVLTGLENLMMIASLRRVKNAHLQISELLERFNLKSAANARVSTYSGGMRRKLDLAMSLIGDPQVVFLDEPTTGLDPQSRLELWAIVRRLAHSGVTIFLTTQYLEEAEALADKVAVLDGGQIVASGTISELKQLIPSSKIEFSLASIDDLRVAENALSIYEMQVNQDLLSICVVLDGCEIETLRNILKVLQDAKVNVTGFVQHQPTLEDVFLQLIGEREAV